MKLRQTPNRKDGATSFAANVEILEGDDEAEVTSVELLHHQPMLREVDGEYICSRCELVNPTNEVPCIPVDTKPSTQPLDEPHAR